GWLVWSGVAVLVVAAASAGGLGPLRILGGPWYSQTSRIVAVFPVIAAPLAAFGAIALASRVRTWARSRRAVVAATGSSAPEPRQRSLAAWIVRARPVVLVAAVVGLACVATLGWYAPQKAERGSRYTLPEPIQWGTMLSAEELALMKRLPETTPADAVILGDPANGAAFAFSISQRRVVFPQLDPSNQSPA